MYVMVYHTGRLSALMGSHASVRRELYSGTLRDTVMHFIEDVLDDADEEDACVVLDLSDEAGGPYQLRTNLGTLTKVAKGELPGVWEPVFGVLRESCPFRAEEKPS